MKNTYNNTLTWQDIDSGILLLRSCFKGVWLTTFVTISIVAILSALLLDDVDATWSFLMVWWLKPLYDRIILKRLAVYVSNNGASEKIRLKEIITSFNPISLFADLTIRRFSLIRAFKLPVYQLEKSKGSAADQRFRVLLPGVSARASNLTILASLLEIVVAITIISLTFYLLPEQITANWFDDPELVYEIGLQYIVLALYIFTLSITEPLYISSGFSLYMNRRKRLEAWDIELAFKNLVDRLQTHDI